MAKQDPRVLKLVGAIFALVGSAMLGGSGWSANRQYTILETWPAVDAQVMDSRVASYRDSGGKRMYSAEIEFRYTVSGKEYKTPASSGYSSSSYTEMNSKVVKYAPGSRHSIRYDPANPNDIRFDVGYNFNFFFLPVLLGGMGLIFGGVGVGLLFASRSMRPLQCPSCGQPVEKGQNFCPNCAAPLPVHYPSLRNPKEQLLGETFSATFSAPAQVSPGPLQGGKSRVLECWSQLEGRHAVSSLVRHRSAGGDHSIFRGLGVCAP